MENTLKVKKKKPLSKGVKLFTKMLKDKRTISEHLRKGGSFEDLKKKGYDFETI